jgi:hypothetical protein
VPLTNDDILDADRVILCPAYDYVSPLRPTGSWSQQYPLPFSREFIISSLTNSLEDVKMSVMNGNIVFFSDLSVAFVSAAADAMYAAIAESTINNSGTIIAKL